MDPILIVNRIADKTAPGRQPAYISAHVLMALEIIESGSGVGRQRLAKELGLGEGSTRTIVGRLTDEGLIRATRGGMTLTESSKELLDVIRKRMLSSELSKSGITVGTVNYAVLVRGAAGKIKSGVEQRDSALIAGAEGATTMVYRLNHFYLPGVEVKPSIEFEKELIDQFKPIDGDVVIIGTAESLLKAQLGAKTAALELFK